MFGINKQKIIVYDTPGFGDSDMGKVASSVLLLVFSPMICNERNSSS